MQQDIWNVQGYDAECILLEINRLRRQLTLPLPAIMRQEFESDIVKWQMMLEESGHQVEQTPQGYNFKRQDTGELPVIRLDRLDKA